MQRTERFTSPPKHGVLTPPTASAKNTTEAHDIADHFCQFLTPQVANNDELKHAAFRIRHTVYCEELAFENPNSRGEEIDEFDQESMITLIKHINSNTLTSCVRLVTCQKNNTQLPIEKLCATALKNKQLHPNNFNRNDIGEISRLAVTPDFRRRKADQFQSSNTGGLSSHNVDPSEIRCFPFIAISLYMSAAAMAKYKNIEHIYVMVEPRLAHSMQSLGVHFIPLGDPINFHGIRAPFYIKPANFIKDLSKGFKKLYRAIEQDIYQQLDAEKNQHNFLNY